MIAKDFKYLRDMQDTMLDVDIKDKEEFIKKLMKLFFCHVIHHFGIGFDRELIANDFEYLRDMLDTMVVVNIKDKEEFIK